MVVAKYAKIYNAKYPKKVEMKKLLKKRSQVELRKNLIDFFTENKDPTDKQVHQFAEQLGMDEHKLEEEVYGILSDFFASGEYYKNPKKVDPEELRIGIKVEMEHTDCPLIAERIAKDHLMEFPDYYTRLIKMEQEAEGGS